METPKKRRRLLPILLGLVVACVALTIIGALIGPADPAAPAAPRPTNTPRATNTPRPTNTPQPTAAPIATPTLEQHILAAIGRTNRADAPATRITIGERLLVTFPANDSLSVSSLRRGAWLRILAIARAVRDNTGNAHDLSITVTGPLVDAYGNSSEQPIMRVDLNRATLARINFDGFITDNLPVVADDYFQHPALAD